MRPAVVVAGPRDAGEDRLGSAERERAGDAGERHPNDSIVGCRGVIGVDESARVRACSAGTRGPAGRPRRPRRRPSPRRRRAATRPRAPRRCGPSRVRSRARRRTGTAQDRPRRSEAGGEHLGRAGRQQHGGRLGRRRRRRARRRGWSTARRDDRRPGGLGGAGREQRPPRGRGGSTARDCRRRAVCPVASAACVASQSLPAPVCPRRRQNGSMRQAIDLNSDLGESFGAWRVGDDAAMFALVSSANVACGFHAGDPMTMAASARLAARHGVSLGAHPGYRDLVGLRSPGARDDAGRDRRRAARPARRARRRRPGRRHPGAVRQGARRPLPPALGRRGGRASVRRGGRRLRRVPADPRPARSARSSGPRRLRASRSSARPSSTGATSPTAPWLRAATPAP